MRSIILSLLSSFFVLYGFSQDHQTNKKTLSRHLREVYDVRKTDWKIKDGAYAVINDANSPVVKGTYANGKKSGVWSYFDNYGKLVQQYDFDHDSLLMQTTDSASVVHANFQIPQGFEDSSKVRQPYKIGGPEYGFYLLFDERDIPQTMKNTSGNAEMTYVLTIDEHGKLESYMILFAAQSADDVVVRRTIKGLPDEALEYTCAMVDGKPVRSKISYTIPLDVSHTSVPGNNYHATN